MSDVLLSYFLFSLFFIGHWYLSLFSQTFFHHRYAAHGLFTMNKFWEKFFYMFAYLTQGSSYLSPRAYAVLHRMHHAYSDTEKDPHSPHHHDNLMTMMWKTRDVYNSVLRYEVTPEPRFTKDLPHWALVEKIGDNWLSRIFWGLIYIAIYALFAPHWGFYFLLPLHFLMGPVHGAIVNWSGHKYGYSSFDNKDQSKNSFLWEESFSKIIITDFLKV